MWIVQNGSVIRQDPAGALKDELVPEWIIDEEPASVPEADWWHQISDTHDQEPVDEEPRADQEQLWLIQQTKQCRRPDKIKQWRQ